ncbi:hypothetical protein [Halomonas sp. KO116]|uniref:hypothetical protein n=1 Tax=Halomonas sp. KO116 TaxID=1504981 RepID=UPI0004E43ED2|nr:hypothetical protein [Halomonas sp. KO116]AJY53292.1 hypothetical protein KO116_P200185 [Halomonas sp. KO116]
MDLFATDTPPNDTATPIDTFRQHITAGDAKAAVLYLRSLDKNTLQKLLLLTGFSIGGTYRQWINYQATKLLDAAANRALPREPRPGDWEAWN